MTYMNLFIEQKQTQTQRKKLQLPGEKDEGKG